MKLNKTLLKMALCCLAFTSVSGAVAQDVPSTSKEIFDFTGFNDIKLMDLFLKASEAGRKYPTKEEFEAAGILQSDIAFIRSHVRKAEILSRADRVNPNTYEKRNLWMNIPMSKGKGAKIGQPSTEFMEDTYSMWNYTNLFGSWNHSLFTAPGSWVDAAHKNGTDILSGIKFFESWTAGSQAAEWADRIIMKNEDGTYKYVDPIINCLMFFGSDGINYNWEDNGITDTDIVEFHRALYRKAKEVGFNNFHIGLYTMNSAVSKYSARALLGDKEGKTAELMLNYVGNDISPTLGISVSEAKSVQGSADGLYGGVWIVSMDRNWQYFSASNAKECGICLWGEHDQSRFWSYNSGGDVYEAQSNYQKLLERGFSGGNRNPLSRPAVSQYGNNWETIGSTEGLSRFAGMAEWIPERSAIQGNLPFATYFNIGNGDRYNYKGKQTAGSWYNMANQDRVPTYRWLVTNAGSETTVSTAIQPEFSHDDAYTGGSCLKLTGDASNATDIVLFKTKLTASSGAYANIAVKNYKEGTNPTDLYIILKKSDGTWVETPVGSTSGKTWEEKKINLNIANGDVIERIGLRVKGGASDYKMYVGKLEINDDCKAVPANVTDLNVEVKEETKTSLSVKATWNIDKKTGERSAWDMVFNDEGNIDHFEVLYKNGENGKVSEVCRTTQWATYIGNIKFENESDKPFIGVRAVSTDLKTYSEVAWLEVPRADQSVLPESDEEDSYGISQIDPNSAGADIARRRRYVSKLQTKGATTNLDYSAKAPQPDGTQYVRVRDQKLVVQQGQKVDITIWGADEDDGLKFCFGGGWMDLDGSGTFNPEKITESQYGECLFTAGTPRASTPAFQSSTGYSTSFTVPTDAAIGKSRLRIVFSDAWFAGQFLPTGLTNKGFSIDFDVEIQGSNPSRPKPNDIHDQGEADEPEGLESSAITTVAGEVSNFYVANNVVTFNNVEKAWIYNDKGAVVKFVSNPTTVDVNDFANGVYIVRMQNGGVIRTGKFVR